MPSNTPRGASLPTKSTPRNLAKFFTALSEGYTQRAACAISGVAHSTVHRRRKNNPEFEERFKEAEERGVQFLEDVARDRAASGKSDILLIFLLKAKRPNVYRDNVKHEHEHQGQVKLQIQAAADDFDRRFADRFDRQRAIEAARNGDS